VPAGEIEAAVVDQLRALLQTPEIVARTWRTLRSAGESLPERAVLQAVQQFDPLWEELFPAEQARIVQLLVERVDIAPDGLSIRLRADGLASLVQDLRRDDGGGGQRAA
jgi:hypothetical protein